GRGPSRSSDPARHRRYPETGIDEAACTKRHRGNPWPRIGRLQPGRLAPCEVVLSFGFAVRIPRQPPKLSISPIVWMNSLYSRSSASLNLLYLLYQLNYRMSIL